MMDAIRLVYILFYTFICLLNAKKLGHLVDTYSLYINVPKYTCTNIGKDVFVISREKVHFLNISLPQESLLFPMILNIAPMKAIFRSIW